MSENQTDLPPITVEDRQLLHYNPNTSDLVEWVQQYAMKACASQRAEIARLTAELAIERQRFDRAPPDDCTISSQCLHVGNCLGRCSLSKSLPDGVPTP